MGPRATTFTIRLVTQCRGLALDPDVGCGADSLWYFFIATRFISYQSSAASSFMN